MPTTGRTCCLSWCRNNSRSTHFPNTKYFQLPSNPHVSDKWNSWILRENNGHVRKVKYLYLCDRHFSPKSILPNRKLVPGTIPTIAQRGNLTSTTNSNKDSEVRLGNMPLTQQENITLTSILSECELVPCSYAKPYPRISTEGNEPNTHSNCGVLSNRPYDPINHSNTSSRCTSSSPENREFVGAARVLPKPDLIVSSASSPSKEVHNFHDTPSTPKNRRPSKRYLGDLSPSDFSTPERAAKYLDMARSTVSKYKRKFYMEEKRRLRLKKKVETLQKLIKHLKKEKQLIKEEAALEIEVHA